MRVRARMCVCVCVGVGMCRCARMRVGAWGRGGVGAWRRGGVGAWGGRGVGATSRYPCPTCTQPAKLTPQNSFEPQVEIRQAKAQRRVANLTTLGLWHWARLFRIRVRVFGF